MKTFKPTNPKIRYESNYIVYSEDIPALRSQSPWSLEYWIDIYDEDTQESNTNVATTTDKHVHLDSTDNLPIVT